jgi:hypothetical protein
MPATKTQLIGGHFQASDGTILANGYLRMFLSADEVVTGVANVGSGVYIQIQLDSNGSVASSSSTPPAPNQFIWSNDVMTPVNSYYRVFGYAANGQLAWGPNNQQVAFGSGTFDVGTWIPNSVISWQPPIQPLTLQVNGANNGSQTLLDLTAGSGITLVDNGSGEVTISTTGASTTFDVNSTPLISSTTVNFEAGTGIAVTNPSAGNVLITNTAPASSGSASGSNVVTLPLLNPALGIAGFNGFTVVLRMPVTYLVAVGTSIQIGILTTPTLPFVINTATIGATLPMSTTWTTAPVAVTWPGGSFASGSTLYLSNPANIVIDTAHDYYIMIYIDPSSSGGPAYVANSTATGNTWQAYQAIAGYLSGNHAIDADATALQSLAGGNILVISQVIIA